jgi:peptidoglycan glycosyltransferase
MTFEKRLWNLGSLFIVGLVLISLRVVYWQLIRGDELQPIALDPVAAAAEYAQPLDENAESETRAAAIFLAGGEGFGSLEELPQPVVQRTRDLLDTITRGSIYDRNGRLLVEDRTNADGNQIRFYTEPSLAHTIGYVSGLRTGVSGLEATYNDVLLGLDRPDVQLGRLLNQPIIGSDLRLTIDSFVQRAAEQALEDKSGAILVFDADSGAILAIASEPRFDPNQVLDSEYVAGLLSDCEQDPICQAPFLNRATQALYPPGSTFKTVTLIAALDSGQVTPETVFDFGQPVSGPNGSYYVYEVDGGVIPDPNHKESQLNLEMSYAKSANAAFARIGDEMPPETLITYANHFGFGFSNERQLPLEIESTPAQLADDPNELYENNLLRAATAIGQGELLTTPMNMGLVVLSALNDGDLPLPYLVESIQRPSGEAVSNLPNRRKIKAVMQPQTAHLVRDMMTTVVDEGSGFQAAIPGLEVGGKTGTAQLGGDQLPHAWFTGFARNEHSGVVIVVLIENGGEGSETAAPIFAQMAQVALDSTGEPVAETVPTPAPPEPELTPSSPTPIPPTPTRQGEQAQETAEPTLEQPTATPTAAQLGPGSPPPPDISRDPDKADITAGSTCIITREGPVGTGDFIWPSQYQALSGGDFKPGHPGIDLSSPQGVPVYAADSGLVIFAGWTGIGYGNAVLIDHGNGFQTLYGHLSQISTVCSSVVEKGELIGLSGDTGNSSGAHLHFEVRVPGGYLNPLKVLPLP